MATIRRANEFREFFRILVDVIQEDSLNEAFNRSYLSGLARLANARIRQRTQGSGFGVLNGRQARLRPLATFTREKRTFLSRLGILSGRTSPATSNLTQSGQMFESLAFDVNPRRRTIRLYFNNTEADRKAAAVEGRRPFFALTNNDLNIYVDRSQNRLARILARRTRNL